MISVIWAVPVPAFDPRMSIDNVQMVARRFIWFFCRGC